LISQYFYYSAFSVLELWRSGEVAGEWIFFMISLMAVIDMKAFAICED
jgi:hypothetical protein